MEFNPDLNYNDVAGLEYFSNSISSLSIKNDSLYSKLRYLTDIAYPSSQDKLEKRWDSFFIPLKRRGELISLPLFVLDYQSNFYLSFLRQSWEISKGDKGCLGDSELVSKIVYEAARFASVIKSSGTSIIEQTFPYDLRIGKIKRKHTIRKTDLMQQEEREQIEENYKQHQTKNLKIEEVSLNDYLNTAAICYRTIFGDKTKGMTPRQMYDCWADHRHDGMLDVKDPSSKSEYTYWQHHKIGGGHPFEIIFSMIETGLHFYPPIKEQPHYSLSTSHEFYYEPLLRSAEALIKNNVPFQTRDLEKILNYLTGEAYVDVNEHDLDSIHYRNNKRCRERYFKFIEWDPIKVVKFK